jgi:NAD+ kinase
LTIPDKPVFAMRLPGSTGALGNPLDLSNLPERLTTARKTSIRPLKVEARRVTGDVTTVFAINEIVVSRQRLQAVELCVKISGKRRRELIGDGLLVATPIGSTGYNRSAGGPALPLSSRLLVLTGLAVHHSSKWCNAVLDDQGIIDVEVVDHAYRQIRVVISSNQGRTLTLLLEDENRTRAGV